MKFTIKILSLLCIAGSIASTAFAQSRLVEMPDYLRMDQVPRDSQFYFLNDIEIPSGQNSFTLSSEMEHEDSVGFYKIKTECTFSIEADAAVTKISTDTQFLMGRRFQDYSEPRIRCGETTPYTDLTKSIFHLNSNQGVNLYSECTSVVSATEVLSKDNYVLVPIDCGERVETLASELKPLFKMMGDSYAIMMVRSRPYPHNP